MALFPKKGKPFDSLSAYHPLCLLNGLGKLLQTGYGETAGHFRRGLTYHRPPEILSPSDRQVSDWSTAVARIVDTAKKAVKIDLHQKTVWKYGAFCALVTIDVRLMYLEGHFERQSKRARLFDPADE